MPAGAVGMGQIQLHSALGKPLDALVPLTHLGDLGPDQLKVGIGSQADYRALGVEFNYHHTRLKLEPVIRDGRGYVHIVSRDPISEPYLDFVVNLRWPNGEVMREYTVLLDPPAPADAVRTAASRPAPAAAAPAEVAEAEVPAGVPAGRATPPGSYTVRRGDSLWGLAERWRPRGVAIARAMGAIYRANPDAFIDGNPARLKESASLKIPAARTLAEAGPLPAAAASPHRAEAAEPSGSTAAETAGVDTAGQIENAGSSQAQLAAENAQLKAEVASLTANVARLNDNLDASRVRLRTLEHKIDGMVDQIQHQRATTQALANAAGVVTGPEGSVVNSASASDLMAPPPARTPLWVHASYWAAIAVLGGWLAFTRLRRRPLPLGAGVLPLDAEGETAEREIDMRLSAPPTATPAGDDYWQHHTAADLPLDLVLPEPTVAPPPAESRRVQAAAPSPLDRDSAMGEDTVDATISAGVFTAFGRFGEAEQVLMEALQREPARVDLKMHLLDVYQRQDKRDAFEALAAAIARDHADDDNTLRELDSLRNHYIG